MTLRTRSTPLGMGWGMSREWGTLADARSAGVGEWEIGEWEIGKARIGKHRPERADARVSVMQPSAACLQSVPGATLAPSARTGERRGLRRRGGFSSACWLS